MVGGMDPELLPGIAGPGVPSPAQLLPSLAAGSADIMLEEVPGPLPAHSWLGQILVPSQGRSLGHVTAAGRGNTPA